jgi:hypothetical protein
MAVEPESTSDASVTFCQVVQRSNAEEIRLHDFLCFVQIMNFLRREYLSDCLGSLYHAVTCVFFIPECIYFFSSMRTFYIKKIFLLSFVLAVNCSKYVPFVLSPKCLCNQINLL